MRRRAQAGFTLLELLVALAITAISLGMLYRASGGNARSVGSIDNMQRAMLLAESLRDLRDSVPAEGWNQAGNSAGYDWRISSAPYGAGVSGPNVPPLHEIHIQVNWQDGGSTRQFDVLTLLPEHKLVPPVRR